MLRIRTALSRHRNGRPPFGLISTMPLTRTTTSLMCLPSGWHRTLLLHFNRDEVSRALECLEDILKQPTGAFVLGGGPFCACRAADGFCYLVCQDRVVLRLSADDAHSLHATLASAGAGLEQTEALSNAR
jgi:hypothetical protein